MKNSWQKASTRATHPEYRLTRCTESDIAKQLAVKLGFLPLALTQAGSYISHTQISFQKYLSLLNGKFTTVAKKRGPECSPDQGTEDPKRTVFTTWEISFASLSHPAQELLLLCGFLANADIPDELFVQESKLPFDWVGEGKNKSLRSWFLSSDFN